MASRGINPDEVVAYGATVQAGDLSAESGGDMVLLDVVKNLKENLLSEDLELFPRYRAMFSLRNLGTDESILALAEGLKSKNALFRHEIAYVLGQIQSPLVTNQLIECLRDENELDMVRHECAEALGSIATDEVYEELSKYLNKSQPAVLRESCVVALDFADYNNTAEFQYADTLAKV